MAALSAPAAMAGAPAADFEARLVPLHGDAVRLAYGMLRNSALAEEAAQEAALRAWRRRGNLRPGSELRPWFLAIVANCCRDVRRSAWWRLGSARAVWTEEQAPAPQSRREEEIVDLRSALRRLAYRDRLVIVLRYYLDLPHEEVAAITGQSVIAVRARASRALRRLRLDLSEVDL